MPVAAMVVNFEGEKIRKGLGRKELLLVCIAESHFPIERTASPPTGDQKEALCSVKGAKKKHRPLVKVLYPILLS